MIKNFIAKEKIKKQLSTIFDDFAIKTSLENGLFIAGGFAREVCHAHFNLNNDKHKDKDCRIINYLVDVNSSGDIDLFSRDEKECSKVTKEIVNHVNNLYIQNCLYTGGSRSYQSEFACNYRTARESLIDNYMEIKVQLVNKFFFNSIKECFDSFDVVNCKYAIKKENKNYVLYYDTEALQADREKLLKLNTSKSPFTISRIVKYLKHRNLNNISEDEKTQEVFLECLYRAIENNWPKYYNLEAECFKQSIKNLHKTISLKPEILSMFIGFIKEQVVSETTLLPNNSGYGVYYANVYKDIDWASHQLINACK